MGNCPVSPELALALGYLSIGYMAGYGGSQVNSANNVSAYTMYGDSVVNNTGNTDIGGGVTNGNGLSTSTGILTLNDSSQFIAGGTITVGNVGAGVINMSGNSSITTTSGNPFLLGTGNGTATMTMGDNASVTNTAGTGDPVFCVGNNGTATLAQSGNSSINTGTGEFWVGSNDQNLPGGASGTYNLYSGSLTVGNWFVIARRFNAAGLMNVSGGLVTVSGGGGGFEFEIAEAGSSGTLNQSGGAINVVNGPQFWIGQGQGSNGAYNMSGGSLALGNTFIAGLGGGSGALNLSGNASITATSGSQFIVGNGGSTGSMTLGGNASYTNTSTGTDPQFVVGNGGGSVATLSQSGNSSINTGGGEFWVGNAGGNGSYNMSGGSLTLGNTFIAGFNGGSGTVNLTGNASITATSGNQFIVGNGGSTGSMTLSGNASYTNTSTGTNPQFVVGNGGGSVATLSQSGNSSINTGGGEFWIGNNGGNGTFNLSGGSITVGNWFVVARNGGGSSTGVMNMSGGVVTDTGGGNFEIAEGGCNGSLNQSGGLVNISGQQFWVAPGGTGVYNLSGGTLAFNQSNSWLFVGLNGGSGTLTQSGSSLVSIASGNNIGIGWAGNGSSGVYNLQGGTLNTWDIRAGAGAYNQSGGVANVNGWFRVGEFAGSSGTANISGGALNIGNNNLLNVGEGGTGLMNIMGGQVTAGGQVNIGGPSFDGQSAGTGVVNIAGSASVTVSGAMLVGESGTGSVTQSGGNVLITGGGDTRIADGASTSVGSYTMSNGTLTVYNSFQPGAYGSGTLAQSGGVINIGGYPSIGRYQGGIGLQTISGGIFNQTNPAYALIVGEQGTGTLTVSGTGTVNCAGQLILGLNYGGSPGTGTVNLNGGVINTPFVAGGGGTSIFNFNGGTLAATTNQATFMEGLTAAYVQDGGAVIDSGGYAITINQALLAAGSGGLTKQGAGILTLTNPANSYAGGTMVNAGTLVATNTGALPNYTTPGAVIVNAGVLAVSAGGSGEWSSTNIDSLLGAVTFPAGSSFGILVDAGNTFSYGTQITGPQGFAKLGGGLLTLGNASNSYAGPTNVSGGTLQLGAATAIPNGGNLSLTADGMTASTATLDLNGFSPQIGALNGGLSGLITNSSSTPVTLTVGLNNQNGTYSGTIQSLTSALNLNKVGLGTQTFGSAVALSGRLNIASGAVAVNAPQSSGLAAVYWSFASEPGLAGGAPTPPAIQGQLTGSLPGLSAFLGSLPAPQAANTATDLNFPQGGTSFPAPFSNASWFAGLYSGMIDITNSGSYTFQRVTTDDNATIYIDGQAVVPGSSAAQPWGVNSSGAVTLSAGMHDIAIAYYQGWGGLSLEAQWSGPDTGNNFEDISTSNANITPDLVVASLSGSGNLSLATGNLHTGFDNTNTTFSGAISGIGAVNKWGTGTLNLAGNNTYTGGTNINAGTLQLGSAAGLPAGGNVSLNANSTAGNTATLDLNGFSPQIGGLNGGNSASIVNSSIAPATLTVGLNNLNGTYSGTIQSLTSVLNLTKVGSGTQTFGSAVALSGQLNIASGAVAVNAPQSSGLAAIYWSFTSQPGLYSNQAAWSATQSQLTGSIPTLNALLGSLGAPQAANTATDLNFPQGGTSFPAPFSNASWFAGLYSGMIDITNSGSYTFQRVNTDDNATIYIDGQVVVPGSTSSTPWGISGSGAVTLSAGMHDIAISYYQGYGGLSLEAQWSGPDTGNNFEDISTSNANITPDLVVASLSGSGNLSLATGNLHTGFDNTNTTFSGAISGIGAVNKWGTGTLNLAGNNTYTGGTNINAGTLQLGSAAGLPTGGNVSLNANSTAGNTATLDLNGFSPQIGALNGGNSALIVNSSSTPATLTVGLNNQDSAFAGTIQSAGTASAVNLTKAGSGTLTFATAAGLNGRLNIASGAVAVNAATSTGLAAVYFPMTNSQTVATQPSTPISNNFVQAAYASNLSAVQNLLSGNTVGLVGNATSLNIPQGTFPYTNVTPGNQYFEALYSGMINITNPGSYTFFNNGSDDDAAIYIDGQTVVQGVPIAAGNPWGQTMQGSISLSPGPHNIVVAYFQGYGNYNLDAQWNGPDTQYSTVDLTTANAQLTPDLVVGSLSGSGNLALTTGNLQTGFDNTSATYCGVISGIGGVNKWGGGTQVLSGFNTYAGATTIIGGTLQIGNGGSGASIGSTSGVSVASGATLAFDQADNVSFSVLISGCGAVAQQGTGTLTLTKANTYTGGTTVSNGTLQLGNPAALGSGGLTANGGVLDLNGNNLTIAGNNALPWLSGLSGTITDNLYAASPTILTINQAGNTTFGGSIVTGGNPYGITLQKYGAGSLTLSGTSTTAGGTYIHDSSTLAITGSLSSPSGVTANDSSTLVISGFLSAAAGVTANNSATLTVNGGLTTVSGVNVNGTAQLTGSGTINITSSGGEIDVTSTNPFTFGGILTGAGGLEADVGSAGSRVTLTGANNYSGSTLVDASAMLTAGTVGTLSPNSAVSVSGTLDVTAGPQTVSSLTMVGGVLNLSVGNPLTSTGSASFGSGTLNISNLAGIISGGTTDLMNYLSYSGSFASYTTLPTSDRLVYTQNELEIVSSASAGPSAWATGNGEWSNAGSWTGPVPSTSGATAAFSASSGTAVTVTLDVPETVGALQFGVSGSGSFRISGANTLTLNNSGSGASILVASGTHTIDVPVDVTDALGLTISGSTSGWTLGFGAAGSIGGTGPLTMSGNGTLILSASNTYSVGTNVEAGTLIAAASGAIPDGTSLTVGAGATLILDTTQAVAGPIVGASQVEPAAGGIVAVPEPGTLVLFAVALWSAAIYCRFSSRRSRI